MTWRNVNLEGAVWTWHTRNQQASKFEEIKPNRTHPAFCSAPRCVGPGSAEPVSCAHPSPRPWTRSWVCGSVVRSSPGSGSRSWMRTARFSLSCPQEDWGGRPTGSVPFQASWLTSHTLPGSDRRWRNPHRDYSSLSSWEVWSVTRQRTDSDHAPPITGHRDERELIEASLNVPGFLLWIENNESHPSAASRRRANWTVPTVQHWNVKVAAL